MSPLEELRHSSAHVLATAMLRLFPETQLDIGPPTENGFYYDVDLDKKLDAADLEAIEVLKSGEVSKCLGTSVIA